MTGLQNSNHDCHCGVHKPCLSPLQQLFAEIDIAAASRLSKRPRAVAAALQPYLGMPDLLLDTPCPCSPERYIRHLLHTGAEHTVLALVWRPGQMSPVHSHRSWCALGVHHGCMTETHFALGSQRPEPRRCAQRKVGSVSHAPAGPDAIHRLANLGTETATSIHIYGVPFDRLGEHVNHVWAA